VDGIILVNKPKGITSYDVVRSLKKKFKISKIGHTGTLDPFAEGLLIICLGKATKLSNMFLNSKKTYSGIVKFNYHYDTYDITGKLLDYAFKKISLSDLLESQEKFKGEYEQMPPIYSAIKKNGKKLYEYARKNEVVEVEMRKVEIDELKFFETKVENEFNFFTKVSKGTYIRSLMVDIANYLNTFGVTKELKRLKIGDFDLKDAKLIEDITISDIIKIEEIFKNHPKVVLNDYMIKLVQNGIYLDERQIKTNKDFLVFDEKGQLKAIYTPVLNDKFKPLIILR